MALVVRSLPRPPSSLAWRMYVQPQEQGEAAEAGGRLRGAATTVLLEWVEGGVVGPSGHAAIWSQGFDSTRSP